MRKLPKAKISDTYKGDEEDENPQDIKEEMLKEEVSHEEEIEAEDHDFPEYFGRPETIPVSIFILKLGEAVPIFQSTPFDEALVASANGKMHEITAEFSVPTTEQLENYRLRASIYQPSARENILQRPLLRRLILINHLKSLNIPGVDLSFDKRGTLSAEAQELLDKLHPSIVDLLILKFQDASGLII